VGSFPFVEIKKYIQLQQGYSNQSGNKVGTWFSLNADSFNQWRQAAHIKTKDSEVTVSINNNSKKSEICQFSARPKLSDYKPLKTDMEWRAWARYVLIITASHSCANVLELRKPPITPDEQEFYHLQNKFMVSMFSEMLLTSKGIVLL
jgi:hypothetical protein